MILCLVSYAPLSLSLSILSSAVLLAIFLSASFLFPSHINTHLCSPFLHTPLPPSLSHTNPTDGATLVLHLTLSPAISSTDHSTENRPQPFR